MKVCEQVHCYPLIITMDVKTLLPLHLCLTIP